MFRCLNHLRSTKKKFMHNYVELNPNRRLNSGEHYCIYNESPVHKSIAASSSKLSLPYHRPSILRNRSLPSCNSIMYFTVFNKTADLLSPLSRWLRKEGTREWISLNPCWIKFRRFCSEVIWLRRFCCSERFSRRFFRGGLVGCGELEDVDEGA